MGLFDVFTSKHLSKRNRPNHASPHDVNLANRPRDPIVHSTLPRSMPVESRRKENFRTNKQQLRQPLSSPPGVTNKTQIKVDSNYRPSDQSPESYTAAHSYRPSHRAKEEPVSRSDGPGEELPRPKTVDQYGSNISTDARGIERSEKSCYSSAGGSQQRPSAIETSNAADGKHVDIRDYFPSPRFNHMTVHPAFRPPTLPPRPHDQSRTPCSAGSAKTVPVHNRSSSSSSASSTSISLCESVATTAATTVVPEEMVPANLGQEVLRQLTSVGFVEERPIQYPMFGGMTRLKTREVGSQSHSFRMSKQDQGYISPRVNSIRRRGPWIAFPRTTTVTEILQFESREKHAFVKSASQKKHVLVESASQNILRQLLLSEEIQRVDLPYVLPCLYWIKTHLPSPYIRLSPLLRTQCNERQRRLYRTFDQIVALKNDIELARALTGADIYDNSIRLCAFLEMFVEHFGPFGVLPILKRILSGRKDLQYGDLKLDHLAKASPESISNLIATIVHSLGQRLATVGCAGYRMQLVADALSLILSLSGELEMGKVFHGVLPKLVAGEVTLCYSLLLATHLADTASMKELWSLFVQKMGYGVQASGSGIPMAVIAIVVVLYVSRDGSRVLFPNIYQELLERGLQSHAKMAWVRLGGDSEVWSAMVQEFQSNCDWQAYVWDNQEALIEMARREEAAREATKNCTAPW